MTPPSIPETYYAHPLKAKNVCVLTKKGGLLRDEKRNDGK
jgi:hypothetical protein